MSWNNIAVYNLWKIICLVLAEGARLTARGTDSSSTSQHRLGQREEASGLHLTDQWGEHNRCRIDRTKSGGVVGSH